MKYLSAAGLIRQTPMKRNVYNKRRDCLRAPRKAAFMSWNNMKWWLIYRHFYSTFSTHSRVFTARVAWRLPVGSDKTRPGRNRAGWRRRRALAIHGGGAFWGCWGQTAPPRIALRLRASFKRHPVVAVGLKQKRRVRVVGQRDDFIRKICRYPKGGL